MLNKTQTKGGGAGTAVKMRDQLIRETRVRRRVRGTRAIALAACAAGVNVYGATASEWVNPVSGSWTDPSKWSSNPTYPRNAGGSTYDVTVAAQGGPYTVTFDASALVDQTISVEQFDLTSGAATIEAVGGTLTASAGLRVDGGTFRLNGATLRGTTISGTGGTVIARAGVLDNVTLQRELLVPSPNVFGNGSILFVRSGLTLDNGTLHVKVIDNAAAGFTFEGEQTVGGSGTVWFDGGATIGVSGKLTIGAGVLVRGLARINYYHGDIVNSGTIRAESLPASSQPFFFDADGGSKTLVNRGLIEAMTGRTLLVNGKFDNSQGTVRANGGTVQINGALTTAQLGSFQIGAGTVGGSFALGATLDNKNATLALDATTGSVDLTFGAITGGRVETTAGREVAVRTSGMVRDLTLAGDLSVYPISLQSHGAVSFHNLTLDGATIHLKALGSSIGSPNAHLRADGPQTIAGTGTILFEGGGDFNIVEPSNGTLTIGPGIQVRTATQGGWVGYYNDRTINQGNIVANLPGHTVTLMNVTNQGLVQGQNGGILTAAALVNSGTISVSAATFSLGTVWTNTGRIELTNGATAVVTTIPGPGVGRFALDASNLNLDTAVTPAQLAGFSLTNSVLALTTNGVVNSTSTNTGTTLDLGPGNTLRLAGGRVNGGTVAGHLVQVSGVGTLNGVVLKAPVEVSSQARLTVTGGMTLAGGVISLRGQHPNVSTTLDLTGLANLFGTGGGIAFDGTGSNLVQTGPNVMIFPGITVRTGEGSGTIGAAGASFTNGGSISAQTLGQRLTVTAKAIDNYGTLEAVNGGRLEVTGVSNTGTVRAAAGGRLTLTGPYSGGGALRVDDATLVLAGSFASTNLASLDRTGADSAVILTGTINNGTHTLNLGVLGPLRVEAAPQIVGGSVAGNVSTPITGGGTNLTLTINGADVKVPIRVTAGATLNLTGAWRNGAGITVEDATLNLGGAFSPAALGTINRTGGTVNLTGTLNNTGLLLLDDTTGTWTVKNGTISGGTVRTAGSARLYLPGSNSLSLRDLTLDTDLALQAATLNLTGAVSLAGHQVFGNGTVAFAGAGTHRVSAGTIGLYDAISNLVINNAGAAATLGPDVLVRGEYLTVRGSGAPIVNQGTIRALAPSGVLNLLNVTNYGRIEIETGGTLAPAATGAASNTARVLLNASVVQFSGPRTQVFGTLDNTATGKLVVAGGADATFNGPVSGTVGTEVRVEAGGAAAFRGPVTGPITFTGDGSVSVEMGASSIGTLSGGSIVVQPQAAMQVGYVRANALTVNGQLSVRPNGTGAATSRVARLEVDPEGVFDLGDNALVVDYADAAPSPLLDIESNIDGGQLTGGAGGGAPPAAPGAGPKYGLGYAEASRILGPAGGQFMGQEIDGSAVLVRYTLLGDANLDAQVDFNDLVSLAQSYNGGGGRIWSEGDFNHDGAVNFADLVSLAQNYNTALPAGATVAGAAPGFAADLSAAFASVPEPGALLWLGAAWAVVGRRRSRTRPSPARARSDGPRAGTKEGTRHA